MTTSTAATRAGRRAARKGATPGSTAPQSGGSLRRASALMASGSLVSRVLGMVRNAMLTLVLGEAVVYNAFSSANVLPNYIYILLAGGLLNAILIPQITKAMASADGGQAQVDRLLTLIFLVVGAIGLFVTFFAGPIMRLLSGFTDENTMRLAIAFAILTMPQVFFYCLYVLFGQVLNARNQFAAFMWAPVLANVVQIAGMAVWLVLYSDVARAKSDPTVWTSGMALWVAGTSTLGVAVQALVLVVPLWRGGFRYRPRFDFRGHGLRSAGTMVGWAFAALVIAQAGGLFSQWVLNSHAKGDVAGYGVYTAMFTIFMIPHSLITTTVVTALFPRLSTAVHARDRAEQGSIVRRCLTTPAIGVIPLSIGLAAIAEPAVRVLNPGYKTLFPMAAAVLATMCMGMWAFGIKTLQERYTFAHEDGRGTIGYQVLVSGVALVFSLVALVAAPRYAALVMAAGLAVSNIVGATAFVVQLARTFENLRLGAVIRLWVQLLVASLVPALLAWGVASLVSHLGQGFVVALLALGLGGTTFVAAFVVVAVLMNIPEFAEALLPVVRRLRRTVERGRTA